MAKINVTKKFTFTHANMQTEQFMPGEYDVPDEVANHFFVQAHTEQGKARQPMIGSAEYLSKMQGVVEGRRQALEDAERMLVEAQKAQQEGDIEAPTRVTLAGHKPANPFIGGQLAVGLNDGPYEMPVINEQAHPHPPGTEPPLDDEYLTGEAADEEKTDQDQTARDVEAGRVTRRSRRTPAAVVSDNPDEEAAKREQMAQKE